MPTWLIIVLAVIVGVLAGLAIGGAAANARRARQRSGRFELQLDEVNRALAKAHASDKGWEREALEAAARRAFAQRRPHDEVLELVLVQVVDPPGTVADKAVFRVVTESGEARLTLGRSGGDWVGEDLE
jgi:hypothetical protein